jgi:hypothetical protein
MKSCNHKVPDPNCSECQRESEKCTHGILKGACTACWKAENPDKMCEHGQFKGACFQCNPWTGR